MSQTAYRTEHLATVPAGYRVRTVTRGGHRVRIAFPPGRRVKGSGQVVEVLHPLHENPCRLSNPAELLVMTNPTYSEVQGSRSRVFFESGRWTATKFVAGLGNIYASGATKGEAQRKLRAEIRAAKERGTWRNPAELLECEFPAESRSGQWRTFRASRIWIRAPPRQARRAVAGRARSFHRA